MILEYLDFQNFLNNWAKDTLIEENISFKNNEDSVPYFIQLLNHKSKLIKPTPRNVSFSRNFQISSENQEGFEQLLTCIKNGANVNPYLSKLSLDGGKVDGLLDNYGLKHFHLGKEEEDNSNFIQRTGELALAFITNEEIFFVASKMHGRGHGLIWYEKDVLEILHQERPDLISNFKVKNFIDIFPRITESVDIKRLRDKQINTYITLSDGAVYGPINFGQSTAGYSIIHSFALINTSKAMWKDYLEVHHSISKDYEIKSVRIKDFEMNSLLTELSGNYEFTIQVEDRTTSALVPFKLIK